MTGTISMTIIYGIVALLSLILIIGYCSLVRKKMITLLLIHFSVFIVNLGYFLLAISKSLEEALLANRIAYLGSVFLPLFMFMAIINVCGIKWNILPKIVLIVVSIAVFLLAASGGYLDVYYKEVSLEFVNGAARLVKEYGPLHSLYLVYLLSYFGLMIGVIVYAMIKKRGNSYILAFFWATIVLGNIGIWFVEQIIRVDFEFLSVSYVVMELLLTLVYSMTQGEVAMVTSGSEISSENIVDSELKNEKEIAMDQTFRSEEFDEEELHEEELHREERQEKELGLKKQSWEQACPELKMLTGREMEVLMLIMENKKRKDIAAELNVSENTVKKHTSHIFSKIGVANRTELFEKIK